MMAAIQGGPHAARVDAVWATEAGLVQRAYVDTESNALSSSRAEVLWVLLAALSKLHE